jgi:hypothetical protein
MVYYHKASGQWVALDPNGNRAYIGQSQANADRAFEIFSGGGRGVASATPAEKDFLAGLSAGLTPWGFLFGGIHEAAGIDTSSREYAWGVGTGALISFGGGLVSEGANTIRVGRWMSQDEYYEMAASGLVQESKSKGVTSVTLPPNPDAYRDAAARSVYVEFNVPRSVIRGADGTTAKIYGPNSIFAERVGITEMPPATGITPIVSKVGRQW